MRSIWPRDAAEGGVQPGFREEVARLGAGPRAAQYLILGAKARAIIHGRFAVSADDIRAMAHPVLRHRIFTNFNADAEGVDVNDIVAKILQTVGEPSYGETIPAGQPRPARPAAPSAHAADPGRRAAAVPAGPDAAVFPGPRPAAIRAGPRAAVFPGGDATAGRSAQPADSAAAAISLCPGIRRSMLQYHDSARWPRAKNVE